MTVEVLISTMHQNNYELLKRMNIQTQAVVINQCDRDSVEQFSHEGNIIVWVNTTQRGLSKSRNMALSYAKGDICLLADDDIVYVDGYEKHLIDAYCSQPKADIVAFNAYANEDGRARTYSSIQKRRESPAHKYYGSVRLSFRRTRVLKIGVLFNTFLGAGAQYGSGEESLFLRQCRKNGMRVYEEPSFLVSVDCGDSSWFNGFNESFYHNKGVFLAFAYRKCAWIFSLYFLLHSMRNSDLGVIKTWQCIMAGIREYKAL